jgi:hypothetical protein
MPSSNRVLSNCTERVEGGAGAGRKLQYGVGSVEKLSSRKKVSDLKGVTGIRNE